MSLPLVVVHGFLGGSDQWQPQAPLAAGREVITVDLPGFGRNAHMAPIDRIDGFAAWVLDQVTARGIDRFDLMGHSMGGMIVQDMVRQAPDRVVRLVLYGTGALGILPGRFETVETSMQRARDDGAEATARRIAATWFLAREAAPAYAATADIAAQASLPAILAGLEAMREWSGAAHLPAITQDTLILWGDCDRTYSWPVVEQLWQQLPTSSLAVVPGCAHAVHSEAPELFNPLVARFLS